MSGDLSLPLHRSLVEPISMAGVPRSAAISIGTLSAAFVFGLQLIIPGIVFWICLHSAAVFAAKTDPDFLTVTARHMRHKAYLTC